jgi:curli biogenesis system outer membrane secretion channel CsgG
MKPRQALAPRPAGAPHRVRLRVFLGLVFAGLTLAGGARAQSAPAVVVWDFDDQSPPGLSRPGGAGDYLKRSLGENLTATLLQVPGLPVVERQRLKDLLAEQKVSATELASEDSRVRLGRIVGAGRMVFGGFFLLGPEVQVHVRVVDTATSRVLFSDELTSPAAEVMQQVEPMNRRLARALGGAATAAGATPAGALATASWRAYDAALALADAGKLDEAVQALQALLRHDKTFTPAERQLVALLDKLARR